MCEGQPHQNRKMVNGQVLLTQIEVEGEVMQYSTHTNGETNSISADKQEIIGIFLTERKNN